jgi:hypothetical protein
VQSRTSRDQATIAEANEQEEATTLIKQIDSKIQSNDILRFPLNGPKAKLMPAAQQFLSLHEEGEIAEYEEIFYLAPKDKKYQPTKLERLVNNGFDD